MKDKDQQNSTILVVDDNPVNLNILSDCLTAHGFTVLLKKDGQKALELIQRKIPDLILLDIIMPNMDGFETCKRLKALDDTKDIPIIFMTALSDTENKVKAFEMGAVDYITKPFHHEEVLSRVKTHITLQRLRTDLENKNLKLEESLTRERKLLEDVRLNLSISLPHELRTPLNAILGYTSTLIEETTRIYEQNTIQYLEYIRESALRLNRLIENALLYANLKLLKYAPNNLLQVTHERPLDVKYLITSISSKKAAEAERESDLELNLTDIKMRLSYKNFEKIILELLDNAFKFSKPGTPVKLETVISGNLFILTITDRGRGMSRDQIANIGAYMQFDRNQQEQQGAGLGLIIAHLLTRLENGVLSIDSDSRRGTTVSVVLNREYLQSDETEPERAIWFDPEDPYFNRLKKNLTDHHAADVSGYVLLSPPLEKTENPPVKLKVLIVDEETEERAFMAKLLGDIGFETHEICGCTTVEHAVFEDYFDLILINSEIPERDGSEKIKKIRNKGKNSQIKIIAVVGKDFSYEKSPISTDLYDDILQTPFCSEKLFEKLEIQLGLEWLYGKEKLKTEYFFPPESDLMDMMEMLAMGSVTGIRNRLDTIDKKDARYATFTSKLRKLTNSFQLKTVREILSKCIET